jgi:predicted ATPase
VVVDRIKALRVRGLRCLGDVELQLDGLSVLIGENGTGKSSLIEALELLRGLTGAGWQDRFYQTHGGFRGLGVPPGGVLALGVTVTDGDSDLDYDVELRDDRGAVLVSHERIGELDRGVIDELRRRKGRSLDPATPMLLSEPREGDIERIADALRAIEVHLPFDVTPRWAGTAARSRPAARDARVIAPATRLDLLGDNLVNVFNALRNNFGLQHWSDTLSYVQLGLGADIEDIVTEVSPAGAEIALWLVSQTRGRIPIASASDGELSYLTFVALTRLASSRSVLALDEPELHLHPALLARVLGLLEDAATRQPVLLATHSDRLLDMLEEPARSVVVCERDEHNATVLRRLDGSALPRWLERYQGGLGRLREDGELGSVIARPQ